MLTLLEALDELNSKSESELTLDYLEELAKKVSIEDPNANANAVTYLYSGGHMDGSGNWISVRDTYIKPEINNQDVRLIDRTHLGQFLDSPEYNEALKLAYINEGYDSVAAATMASNYTRGTGTTGPWAEASRRFASETTGEIRIFFDNPDPNRVWWQTEMPQILDSGSGVTSINGVPADQFRNVYNTLNRTGDFNALDVVNDTIYNIPPTNTNPNRLIGDIATGKSNIIDAIDDVPTLPGRHNGTRLGSRIGSVLGVLGAIGDVGDLYYAGTVFQQAYQQFKNSKYETASDTLGSWGMSTLGSIAGGAGAGGLAGIGMGTLVAAGLVSGPIGWAAIAAAGFAGGILGGKLGEIIWDKILDPLNDEYTDAGNAQPPRDPLAIDLGALGIDLTTLENGVNFDLDKNGFAEKNCMDRH